MKAQITKIQRERCAGFNLVEIAMALAIISFSCTLLLGLLPASLTAFHQAMGNTIESQIVQSISNDVALNNFSALSPSNSNFPTYYYYDHEGQLLSSSTTASPPTGYFYSAQVAFNPVTSSNSPANLNTTPAPAYKVNVNITNVAQAASASAHVYSFIVANNGL